MQVSSALMPPGHQGHQGPHGLGMPQPIPGPQQSQGGPHSSSARQSASVVSIYFILCQARNFTCLIHFCTLETQLYIKIYIGWTYKSCICCQI